MKITEYLLPVAAAKPFTEGDYYRLVSFSSIPSCGNLPKIRKLLYYFRVQTKTVGNDFFTAYFS